MPEDYAKRVTQLLKAFEAGLLDEDTYRAALIAIGQTTPSAGAIVTGGGVGAGAGGAAIGGNVAGSVSIIGTQVVNQRSVPNPPILVLPEAVRRYTDYVIDTYEHLQLQGIRAGGQPLSVELEKVYISLTTIEESQAITFDSGPTTETPTPLSSRRDLPQLTIQEALNRRKRLVVIGDPGSGKTTLLSWIALTYARDLRQGGEFVLQRLNILESGYLPILMPIRDFGRFLKSAHSDASLDGPGLLLTYLHEYYSAQSIPLPVEFFAAPLEAGYAAVLLDGLDELAEKSLRQRVARIIERLATRYPNNRYLVTSREVGYEGVVRIGASFALARIRDFTQEDIRQFVIDWTRATEAKSKGRETPDVLRHASEQAAQLVHAIEQNPRLRTLAVNPLLLTVIALVHRYRAALPERRSELYDEAVEVLLARWDEAKGLDPDTVIAGRPLDAGDRRGLLEPVALWLHELKKREVERDELQELLKPAFRSILPDDHPSLLKATNTFLNTISERSGLLVERGVGVFSFAHLTFQEHLAARAVADRDDFIEYTLTHLSDPWWREVVLLEAGYLSTQGKRRVSNLIRAIIDTAPDAQAPLFHNLLLASECVHDTGVARLDSDVLSEVKRRLRLEIDSPIPSNIDGTERRSFILRKVAAANAIGQIESAQFVHTSEFWCSPWGEPEWVHVPGGRFWFGDPMIGFQRVFVPMFKIGRVPITNAQYAVFMTESQAEPPSTWSGTHIPNGKANHPVEGISWLDAQLYCKWLSERIGRTVRLPIGVEWEKAVRGDRDKRAFPWGNTWVDLNCNSKELGLGDTSPVGLFPGGASPYGCHDLAGNVWEWCQSPFPDGYRYVYYENHTPNDEAEGDLVEGEMELEIHELLQYEMEDQVSKRRMLRGGAFSCTQDHLSCGNREGASKELRLSGVGFRVVCGMSALSAVAYIEQFPF